MSTEVLSVISGDPDGVRSGREKIQMAHTDDDSPELLTTAEVARIFRVARSTVANWADKGLLPYTRTPSGRLRFHRASVERFLREHHGQEDP